mmetsp:Transcript_86309/g.252530  ORF Transcript_86309/g.252530 Transcript_86309/m.252530 type:complete len:530 (+) Transcript_86309:97-1686(+)
MAVFRCVCTLLIAFLLSTTLAGARANDLDDVSLIQTYAQTQLSAARTTRAPKAEASPGAKASSGGVLQRQRLSPLADLSVRIQHAARLDALQGFFSRHALWSVSSPEHRKRSLEDAQSLAATAQGRPTPDLVDPLLPHTKAASKDGHSHFLQWFSDGFLVFLGMSLLVQFVVAGNWLSEMRQQTAMRPYSVLALEAVPKTTLAARVSFYGFLYIVASAAFISYNNYLVSNDRFPFAANLAMGHQVCGSLFLLVLYQLCPFLYPSLVEPQKRAKCFTLRFFLRGGLPIACCFSMQLVLSNFAYLYASVAFLQMMKEGNMVLVYCLSLLAGLERFHGVQASVLFCLLCSTVLTVEGELSVSTRALIVQGGSQLLEATKIVAQSSLLSAAGSAKLDALSYNLLIQPLSAIGLFIFVTTCMAFVPGVATATWSDYVAWWPHLVGNACTALALNVLVAVFISKTSAVGFIVVGIVKDIVLVVSDVLLEGTHISALQVAAFSFQILFVAHYSFFKTFSKQWANLHRWNKPQTTSP